MRTWLIAGSLVLLLGAAAAQQADIRNGRIEASDTPVERAVASLGAAAEPVWVGWRVPMVKGLRDLCGTWSDGSTTVRAATLEDGARPASSRAADTAARVADLEAGTALLVWLRVVDGQIERLRVVSDDCPVDAGGRQVVWLSSITAVDSVRFLETLLAPPSLPSDAHRRLASAALMGIALHADATADGVLDRFLTPTTDRALRTTAAGWTARVRGARGFSRLMSIVRSETDTDLRRAAAAAIAQTREPGTLPALWGFSETDTDEDVRAGSLGAYAELAPEADVARVVTRLTGETSDKVRQHAVRGLARRPATSAIPQLVNLARTSTDKVVRTEAVRGLSRSSDPAAIAYLAEVLR